MAESKEINYVNTKTQISTSSVSGDVSVKSGITDLPLGNVNFEVNAIMHDSQHKSESSCSNSLSVNLPISFSNSKFLETSKEAYSRYTSSTNDKLHTGNVGKSSVCSDISDSFNCTSKTVENIRSCDEHDNVPTPRSGERMIINHEILGEGEHISGVKDKYESSESSIAKIAEFDLNEDINENGVGDFIQPVVGNVPSRVVAITGMLSGRPVIPLEFEGGLGWTGSSEMSAFRAVSISKIPDRKMRSTNYRQKDTDCCFTGIDLNVAAVEDSADFNGIISTGPHLILQDSRSEVDLERDESLSIDLNRLYDASDDLARFSIPVKSKNSPLLDLNLNVNTNKPMKSIYQDFNPISRDYQPDLSTIQHLASHASLQSKFPFLSHTLPPQSYPSFKILPGLFNPGTVNTSFGNNHFQQVFHEHRTEDKYSASGSKSDEARQYLFLADNSSWFETSNKRKETEGGFGYEKGIWKH